MSRIDDAKRIVIKVGSALVTDQDTGVFNERWLNTFIEDIAALKAQGKDILIVSSGAVATGRRYLGLERKVLKLEEKQAAAACGQVELVACYRRLLEGKGLKAAQILLTIQDSESRRRYLNARNTIETLFAVGVVPIVNENDTVATSELRFGDNDRLAARVAQMITADVLVLLSDIDGLYSANPRLSPSATHIAEVHAVTEEIESMAGGALSHVGSGGMITKVQAGKIATQSGCHMVIAKGNIQHPIRQLRQNGKCTWFISNEKPLGARKQWIAHHLHVKGEVIIDQGAIRALRSGKSLLPAGVIDVKGQFDRGDAVAILDHNLREVGRGLTAYGIEDAKLIRGHQSNEIENLTGFSGRNELIHRDDLVLVDEA